MLSFAFACQPAGMLQLEALCTRVCPQFQLEHPAAVCAHHRPTCRPFPALALPLLQEQLAQAEALKKEGNEMYSQGRCEDALVSSNGREAAAT